MTLPNDRLLLIESLFTPHIFFKLRLKNVFKSSQFSVWVVVAHLYSSGTIVLAKRIKFAMASNSSLLQDSLNFIGPAEPNQFDFTPLFEDTFLSIVPSTILLLLLPFRVLILWKKPRKVAKSSLHGNKIVRRSKHPPGRVHSAGSSIFNLK